MFKCSHYLFKTRIKATEAAFDNPLSINIKLFALINPRNECWRSEAAWPELLNNRCWGPAACSRGLEDTAQVLEWSLNLMRGMRVRINIQGRLQLITKGLCKALSIVLSLGLGIKRVMLDLPGRESYSKLSLAVLGRINDLCTHYSTWQIKGL